MLFSVPISGAGIPFNFPTLTIADVQLKVKPSQRKKNDEMYKMEVDFCRWDDMKAIISLESYRSSGPDPGNSLSPGGRSMWSPDTRASGACPR